MFVVGILGAAQLLHCSISSLASAEQGPPVATIWADAGLLDAGAVAGIDPDGGAPVERGGERVEEVERGAKRVEGAEEGVEQVERGAKRVEGAEEGVEQVEPVEQVEAPAVPEAKRAPTPPEAIQLLCPESGAAKARLFFSPAQPVKGQPLRVIAVADEELQVAGILLIGPTGRTSLDPLTIWGGPPWSWSATLETAPPGRQHFAVASNDPAHPYACGEVEVAERDTERRRAPRTGVWPIERAWDGEMEDLYAAWIGRLFRIDPGAKAGWRPLHTVLRDAKRNFLYGHLGLDEDNPAGEHPVVVAPDCGDTPFFLRGYFAWKLRLPYAVRHCLRGTRERGTACDEIPETNLNDFWDDIEHPVERFNAWLEEDVGDTVHSGTGRILPEVDPSELYPVALSRETLRPGVVFVDPGGHVLVVSQWVQGTRERIGMLLAVDAHPDRTVSHKRFSRANFFYDAELKTGGFKAFRPVRYERGKFRFWTNDELRADPGYPAPSMQQYEFRSSHAYYRTVDVLLNPEPLDPLQAYRWHMEALIELLEERVSAVQVGVDYQKENDWTVIPMPVGGEIFETTGPWEDYSTPARDLRLLIAMDELNDFPQVVFDSPAIFRLPEGAAPGAIERMLRQEWQKSSAELGITYVRSDGSPWRLSLAEIMRRIGKLEQSYNPNDCIEIRWGAARTTDEMSTCDRHAPEEQTTRMQKYRFWHANRQRPSRY